ncbi:hypothetical protein A3L09_02400 [Thermococcus profundus]|uniref:Transglutaminase-like domain-containing protein n=1 Tax=Thermococcus profundus TaxID=49899 RepID=A0A2Z2M7J9_THEPR|nr:hypothetical protein A3L09_02400 [Thermococcus profundus]
MKSLRTINVYYPANLSFILSPLYPRNFSVPVEYNPLLDLYIPKGPLSNYSITYWETERPSSGEYFPAPEGLFKFYMGFPYSLMHLAMAFGAADNPDYENLLALERFFRENFIVSEDSNSDCEGLFDMAFRTRRGSSYDIASAFAVIARMMGFPTRLVAGYRVPASEDYRIVPFSNVTYWPEVEFRNLGWVRFDPVPSSPVVFTEASYDRHFKIRNIQGKVYWDGSLREPPFEIDLERKTVLYLPVWGGTFRYLRLVPGDVGIDVVDLPPFLSPGEEARVRVLLVHGLEFTISSEVPVERKGEYELSIRAPDTPGVYWITFTSKGFSVKFPIVVTDNVTVTVEGYPSEIRAGSNFTVFGRVLWHGQALSGGTVEAVLGLRKGEARYVVGRAEVRNGKYTIHASVPKDIAPGNYWLVVRYLNFPYLGDSDPVVRILPAERITIGSSGLVPAGDFNLTGTAPKDVPIDVLLDGQKVASVVPKNGLFSVPLNASPGDHELKLIPRSGELEPLETKITAVKVNLDMKPYSSMGRDYLKLIGTVEGMKDGKLEIQTPSGKVPVEVKDGRFELNLPVEFPEEGSSGVNTLPLKFLIDGTTIDEKEIALSSGRILPNLPTVVKSNGKFFVALPEGLEGENLKFSMGAFDSSGRSLSGKLGLNLGGKRIELPLKGGIGHLEIPKADFEAPKVNLPSVGDKVPSINLPSPDVSAPIGISGFSPSFGGNFILFLILPFVLLGAVLLVRAGVSGGVPVSLDRLKSLGSPEIELEREVYLPGEKVKVVLSRESDLYVDGKHVGHGRVFSLSLPEGVHTLKAGRRERIVYVLRPKKAVIKLYEDYFLPFAASRGVRVADSTPEEIKAALLSKGLQEGPLSHITRIFELARYGDVELSREEFEEFVEALRSLEVVK